MSYEYYCTEEVARTVDDIAKGAQDQAEDTEKGAVIAQELSHKVTTLNETTAEMLQSKGSIEL